MTSEDELVELKIASSVESQMQSYYISHKMLLLSNSIFVLASLFYVIAAIVALVFDEYNANIPILGIKPLVSSIFEVLGGASFCILGVVDMHNSTDTGFQSFMILAGAFGVGGSLLDDYNTTASTWFTFVSALLYWFESVNMFYGHLRWKRDNEIWISSMFFVAEIGDFCFFAGALLDIAIAIFYIRVPVADNDGALISNIVSAALWLLSATIALAMTIKIGEEGFKKSIPVIGVDASKKSNEGVLS